jgi:hypothetical protein
MSSYGPDIVPGDYVAAAHLMRAWEADDFRGTNGRWITEGSAALVVQVWRVGGQQRIRVFIHNKLFLFSCLAHCVLKNWNVIESAPRLLPTSASL